jgi:aminomethyltransferase
MDTATTPVEASLAWALSKARRADGARPGAYPGADIIMRQLAEGVARKRVGLLVKDRMPVREGAELVNADGRVVGKVTSGGFGPTLGGPVAMGYVETEQSRLGTALQAIVRGKPVPVEVVKTPFTPQRYYRG